MLVFKVRPRVKPQQREALTNSQRRIMALYAQAAIEARRRVLSKRVQLLDAIEHRSADYVADLVDWVPFYEIQDALAQELQAELIDTARDAAKTIPAKLTKAAIKFSFDEARPEAARWARKYAGDEIIEITSKGREAIKKYVSEALDGALSARDVARGLVERVGLTEQQAQWVDNYRTRRQIINADKRNADTLTERQTERYYNRVLKYRTEMIARTEILKASSEGRRQTWEQGVNEGFIPRSAQMQWMTNIDGRECESCTELDGLTVPLSEGFPEGDPPYHPNCRCTVLLVDEPDSDLAGLTDEELDMVITNLTKESLRKHGDHDQSTHGRPGGGSKKPSGSGKKPSGKKPPKEEPPNEEPSTSGLVSQAETVYGDEMEAEAKLIMAEYAASMSGLSPWERDYKDGLFGARETLEQYDDNELVNDAVSSFKEYTSSNRRADIVNSEAAAYLLHNAPLVRGTLYRGMSIDDEQDFESIASLARGQTLPCKGCASWSVDEGVASDFATTADYEVMVIADSGMNGIPLEPITRVSGEYEYLCPNDVTVDQVVRSGNRVTVYVTGQSVQGSYQSLYLKSVYKVGLMAEDTEMQNVEDSKTDAVRVWDKLLESPRMVKPKSARKSHKVDVLAQIEALTDLQLQAVAARQDATGVLAEVIHSQRHGLPAPSREALVMCDGYALVASAGKVLRVPSDQVSKIIQEQNGEYCVYSADGQRKFGCYPTAEAAQQRLAQIHSFSDKAEGIREGSFVSWNSSGGTARGRVEYVMTEGTLGVPDSAFSINATEDNPAVLIRVWREGADGWQETETLVGHRMDTLNRIETLAKETFKPPQGVQDAGKRALAWIAEGHAGGGFTDVGRARAAQLARGDNLSEQTIRRMYSYLARHAVDSQASGWNNGEPGFPSPGRVAWDAWGGDPAVSWTRMMVDRFNREQKKNGETEDGLTPRQRMMYESLEEVAEVFGAFDTTDGPDGAHYMSAADNPFIAEGLKCSNCVFYEGGGICEILSSPVEEEGICKLWIIPEALIDGAMAEGSDRNTKSLFTGSAFMKKNEPKRFTLGPLYVPEFMDAHGEWTDANELQKAVWEWVKSGDRSIYLQHDRNVKAGEWVEVMTMPNEWTVPMVNSDGESIGQVTYPAGTVFLGVQWDEPAWQMIKRGQLRGYSIGGVSDRVMVDLPNDAVREGVYAE